MKKVNIEIQLLAVPQDKIRGIPIYIIELINKLEKRHINEYSYSFFDYKKRRDNKRTICSYLDGGYNYKECNDLSYRDIMDAILNDNHYLYGKYTDYFGYKADIYHFPYSGHLPHNVDGNVVVTVHDILPVIEPFNIYFTKEQQVRFDNSMRYIANHKDILLASISNATKDAVIQHYNIDESRIFVTPLGYNDSLYGVSKEKDVLKKYNISSPYLLYLGALDPRKGIDVILKAFDRINNKDVKLVIAGASDSSFFDIIREVSCCRRKDDVILTGHVSEIDKRDLMANADVFLFPSLYEGFGLPILEAMASGTPVITTNVSSMPEVGGDAALYIEPGNVEQLAENIDFLLMNKVQCENIILKGLKRCKEFSWDRTAELTEMIYEKFL